MSGTSTGPLTLTLIGDESAAGAGAATTEEALPSVLAGMLAQALAGQEADAPVTTGRSRGVLWQTLGEQGASTLRVHGRQLAQLSPSTEVVVVMVGLHDLLARHNTDEWRREMSAILRLLVGAQAGRRVVVCGCPPVTTMPRLRWPMTATLDAQASRFDELTRELCAEHGACFVSLRETPMSGRAASPSVSPDPTDPSPTEPASPTGPMNPIGATGPVDPMDPTDPALFAADGIHAAPALQRAWAERITAALTGA